jgi:hypothetical protein
MRPIGDLFLLNAESLTGELRAMRWVVMGESRRENPAAHKAQSPSYHASFASYSFSAKAQHRRQTEV